MPRNFVHDQNGGLVNVYHVERFVPVVGFPGRWRAVIHRMDREPVVTDAELIRVGLLPKPPPPPPPAFDLWSWEHLFPTLEMIAEAAASGNALGVGKSGFGNLRSAIRDLDGMTLKDADRAIAAMEEAGLIKRATGLRKSHRDRVAWVVTEGARARVQGQRGEAAAAE